MPSNEELTNRAHQLVAEITSLTQSEKQHCDEYRALANDAYVNLQAFLKSKGCTTVDDWLKICQKELSPDDAAKVQQTLAALEPPAGLTALVQPTEIAKFIASCFILKGAMPLFQAAALGAKSFYHEYLVINRIPIVEAGAVGEELAVSTVASTTEELAEATTFLEGGEVPTLIAAADAEIGEVVAATAAEAAEVAAVATAEAACAWNIFLLAAGAIVLAGTYAYQKHIESGNAEKLREVIAKLATARLYAYVGNKVLLSRTNEQSLLRMLSAAFKEGNTAVEDFMKNKALKTAQASTAVDVRDCYQQLHAQDLSNNAMIDADPDVEDMIRRHAAEVQAVKT